jgi:uncharacterized protein with HEPN domain
LDDVVEWAEKTDRLVQGHTFKRFCADESGFDAALMNLLVIGEATKNFPAKVREAAPEVNWVGAAGLRDVIVNQHFGLAKPANVDREGCCDPNRLTTPK